MTSSLFLPKEMLPVDSSENTDLINALNEYNPKLNVSDVKGTDELPELPFFHKSLKAGLLLEEINEFDDATGEGTFQVCGTTYFPRAYVFIIKSLPGSRDAFIAQDIFPCIMDYMGDFLNSPSYSLANHPVFFINMAKGVTISAPSMLKSIARMIHMGIHYVDVYGAAGTLDLAEYTFETLCLQETSSYYSVDKVAKKLMLKDNGLDGLITKNGAKHDFLGSKEKFYWLHIIPTVYLAFKNRYQIDISGLASFLEREEPLFATDSDKMRRCKYLYHYFRKFLKLS